MTLQEAVALAPPFLIKLPNMKSWYMVGRNGDERITKLISVDTQKHRDLSLWEALSNEWMAKSVLDGEEIK